MDVQIRGKMITDGQTACKICQSVTTQTKCVDRLVYIRASRQTNEQIDRCTALYIWCASHTSFQSQKKKQQESPLNRRHTLMSYVSQ